LIGFEMWPSFRQQLAAHLPKILHNRYYTIATSHAALGVSGRSSWDSISSLVGTNLAPRHLRFKDWK
jgi:hypothetical protein